jgi:hypothetical protein
MFSSLCNHKKWQQISRAVRHSSFVKADISHVSTFYAYTRKAITFPLFIRRRYCMILHKMKTERYETCRKMPHAAAVSLMPDARVWLFHWYEYPAGQCAQPRAAVGNAEQSGATVQQCNSAALARLLEHAMQPVSVVEIWGSLAFEGMWFGRHVPYFVVAYCLCLQGNLMEDEMFVPINQTIPLNTHVHNFRSHPEYVSCSPRQLWKISTRVNAVTSL